MSIDIDDETKNKGLYKEIRYARMSSISLKPSASIFRLKRNHQNLSTVEYTDNLCSYLCSARSCKTITLLDLNNVIHGIAEKVTNNSTQIIPFQTHKEQPDQSFHQTLDIGEHVAAFWVENDSVKWHLGIVEGYEKSLIRISYMTRADMLGTSWTFPETAEVLETSSDQILASKIKVQYSGTVRIRCQIVDEALTVQLNEMTHTMEK